MRAVLLSSDLMLVSMAQGIADRHGVELLMAATSDEALTASAAATAVAIDLRTLGLNVASLIADLREQAAPPAVIVAFGPHVHTEALAAAAAAGCDEVITRGQFEHRFDALLAALTAPAARDQN
jgi:DNA-binding NarL/FixJ family response regulator